MPTFEDSRELLKAAGFQSQHLTYAAWNVLPLAGLGPTDPWSAASNATPLTISKGIMKRLKDDFGKEFAPNTRESLRKALRDMEAAEMVVRNPHAGSTVKSHSKNFNWGLTPDFTALLRSYGTSKWPTILNKMPKVSGVAPSITSKVAQKAIPVFDADGQPLVIPGTQQPFRVVSEPHGQLIKDILEWFPTLFQDAVPLYAQADQGLPSFVDAASLAKYGVTIPNLHIPDVILGQPGPTIIFVEAYISGGHITTARSKQLQALVQGVRPTKMVTAFETRAAAKPALNSFQPGSFVWFRSERHKLIDL